MLPLPHLYRRTPIVLGHRGASAYTPENTLVAFERALAMGADGFELDVTLSADGVPVVIHDDTLDRTTDGHGPVSQLNLAEIKKLDAGYAARWGGQFARERIPTLAEVFEAFRGQATINVELKRDRSPEGRLAREVVALIRSSGLAGRVIVSSFQLSSLRRVRELDAALPVGVLYTLPAFATRLNRCLKLSLAPAAPPEAHHPESSALSAVDLRWYHAHGYRVNTWTVNDEATMRRLSAAGVDGLITDRPDVAVAATRI